MEDRTVSISIPTWNRVDVLIESFSKVLSDERVENIHIQDDASDIEIYKQVKSMVDVLNTTHNNKITISRNLTNQDCFRNKQHAVLGAKSEWVVLLDSDNIIDTDYLDRLYEIENWDAGTIYTPDNAYPNFDFTAYSGLLLSKENISENIDKPLLETMLNASNYFIHKDTWLSVWDGSENPVTSDSIYVCMKWLQSGKKIKVVQGLKYFHRVWEQSHYRTQNHRTPPGFHQSILDKIKQLK